MSLKVFWLVKDETGRIQGPLEHASVLEKIRTGIYRGQEQVQTYPSGEWRSISRVPEFYDLLIEALAMDSGVGEDSLSESKKTNSKSGATPVQKPTQSGATRALGKGSDGATKTTVPSGQPSNANRQQAPSKAGPPEQDATTRIYQPPREEPTKVSEEVIDLVDESHLIKEHSKTKFLGPILMIAVGALAAFFILDEDQTLAPAGKISLLLPKPHPTTSSPAEAKEKVALGLKAFFSDTFQGYYQAQSLFVEAIEAQPKMLEPVGLLCMTYRELWPYAKQDANDLTSVSQLSQMASQLDALGETGAICRLVQLLISGQFEGASSKARSSLQQFQGNPFLYEIRSQLLADIRDHRTAISFAQRTQQLLPKWVKPFVFEARNKAKLGDFSGAHGLYGKVLAQVPRHAVAKIEMGLISYYEFRQEKEGVELIMSGLDADRSPGLTEVRATETLAKHFEKMKDDKRALQYALAAYKLNPSLVEMKNIVMRLGGNAVLSPVRAECQEVLRLGDQYAKTNNHVAAQAEYRAAFESCEPKSAVAALKAGKSLWALSQSSDAISWLEKAVSTDPKLIDGYVYLSRYLAERFDFDKAYATLRSAYQVAPNSFEIIRAHAFVELRRNNHKEAIRLGESALKLYDADIETHHLLAKAYEGAKDYRQSFQIAARGIELDRSNAKSQALYAESLAGVQGFQSGVDYIMGLINTYPTEITYRMSLARIYRKEDRFFEAIETLKGVLAAEPNNKEAAILMGQMYQGLKQNREALDAFLMAVTIDPSDAYPVILIGDLYLQSGEFQNALENFESAREMNPKYPRINYFVGRAAFFLRDYKRAIDEAKKETRVNPNLGEAYVLTGESYINLGFYDADGRSSFYSKAVEALQSALRLKIQTAEIYILLARAQRLSGNLDIAASMLNVASAKESGNPEIFKEQGAIFEKKGQLEQAMVSYKRYLELAPSAPDYSQIQDRIRKIGGG